MHYWIDKTLKSVDFSPVKSRLIFELIDFAKVRVECLELTAEQSWGSLQGNESYYIVQVNVEIVLTFQW